MLHLHIDLDVKHSLVHTITTLVYRPTIAFIHLSHIRNYMHGVMGKQRTTGVKERINQPKEGAWTFLIFKLLDPLRKHSWKSCSHATIF